MRRSLIVAVMVAAAAGTAAAKATSPKVVAGKVFLDANSNGKLDKGEKGIPGVRVTDGVGFAVTNAAGAWRLQLQPDPMLPVPGTQVIAVCWPSGRWPTGKFWTRVKDAPDPSNVNFGLRTDKQKLPVTYLHVTDNHDWRAAQYQFQHETVNHYLKDAKFIVNTGDMGFGGATPKAMAKRGAELQRFWAKNVMPTFGTIGNHDTDSRFGKDHEYSFAGGYAALLGPLRFSFDVAGIHFVFVDVIENNKKRSDFTAAWLEKDFASLRPGTRIILFYHWPVPNKSKRWLKVLAKYKVEQIHAGHNHRYGNYRGPGYPAPVITAYARSACTANVMVVDKAGTHAAVFCEGCKSHQGPHTFIHSNYCPTQWRRHVLEPAIKNRYGPTHTMKSVKLDSKAKAKPTAVSLPYAYIQAEFTPGSAKAVGLRIGKAGKPLEIAFTGKRIVVAGAAFPFLIPKRDKTLKLHVFAHRNLLTVYANRCFFTEHTVKLDRVGRVTPFAAGGQATLKAMTVREVKPDPANRNGAYFCHCAHGGIRRNPDPK